MILAHWRAGRDVNELLRSMVIEIHDANPDLSEMAFITHDGDYLDAVEETFEEVQPKPRARRQSVKADTTEE